MLRIGTRPPRRLVHCTTGIYLKGRPAMTLIGMSRPPVHTHVPQAAGALLLLLSLSLLVGCQGVSAGGSQNPTGNLSLSALSVNFGTVPVGSTKILSITATNTENQTITISSAAITTKYFALTSPALPTTVAPGQNLTIVIQFSPNAGGNFNATASVNSNATNNAVSISLSGVGQSDGQLALSPASVDFGSVVVGSTKSQTVTLTNTGTAAVNVSQATISGTGFQLSGINPPLSLNPSQSTTFTVTFAPTTTGNASGTVTVVSDASNPSLSMNLSGAGIAAGALGSNPTSLSFGSVLVGSSKTLSETVTNTGASSVKISAVSISGSGFSFSGITPPVTLGAGQSATFNVTFTPASSGNASGNVTVTSNASNTTLTIPLSGTGATQGTLGANPTSLSFGNVMVGTNKSLSETITNTGGSNVTISAINISGAGFSVSGAITPTTLIPAQSTTFSVVFAPTSAGTVSGNLTITSDASNPTLSVPVSGTAVAQGTLGANPTSLSFGNVQVGNSKTLSETVTNTGGSSLTISAVSASGTGFSLSGISAPVTLNAGQSATFNVTFAPTTAGAASGNVKLTSDGSNPTLNIPLSGTGVAQGALGANPTSLSFGSVVIGNSKTLSETVTNTGGSSLTISAVSASGTGFSVSGITPPVTLNAGQSATFSVTFTPTASGAVSGNVAVTSNGSNPTLNIPLSGTGVTPGDLAANPTSLSFGNVAVGGNSTLSETVTNTGGSSVTISAVSASGSGFSVSGINPPVTLNANQSATFSVTFAPTSAGSVSGNVTVTSNASNPTLNIATSGTGTAAGTLSVNPTTLALGSVVVGTSGTGNGTLTASGAAVTVTAASTNNSVFSVGGLSLPVTIPAGNSVPFTITFSPAVTGAVSATLTFTSNASPTTTTETLTGTGTPAPVHSVALSWTASTSSNIQGYNVYRAPYNTSTNKCGSFGTINSGLVATTVFTDSIVVDGSAYCYATTAVNTSNQESGYSNIVTNVQIPPP